ncbi:MAG: GTP-binding protein [Oscillospiraceae bacterium]
MGSEVKLDLISGFRGSGKTTLLGQMARGLWSDERVVLLQNEQGKRKLARETLPENCAAVEWQGGCLCCTAAALLEQALWELAEQYRPGRIVIELAETSRLADLKASLGMAGHQIEHIIYVLRADTFAQRWDLSGDFAARQLRESPAVWLTHGEEADTAALDRIRAAVSESNPRCAVVDSAHGVEELYRKSRVYKRIGLRSALK